MAIISFCGTHSSGKTTLTKQLAEVLNIPYFLTDDSKNIAYKLGIDNLDELNLLTYEKRLAFQLEMLKSLSISNNNCVVDGNPLSCIPYGKRLLNNGLINEDFEFIKSSALENSDKIEHVFYLPPEIKFEIDDFRYQDFNLRYDIDSELFNELLNKNNFKILTGTIDDRISLVLKVLGIKKQSNRENHIVFEGINNSGKSTIMNWVSDKLNQDNIEHYVIGRPENKDNKIKDNLEFFYNNTEMYKKELFYSYLEDVLFFHKKEGVNEKVSTKKYVLADRQKFSVIAYGLALGFQLGELYAMTKDLPTPGTVILFDINTEECVQRSSNLKPLFNFRSNYELQNKINNGFKLLAQYHPEIKILNASQSPANLLADVLNIILNIK